MLKALVSGMIVVSSLVSPGVAQNEHYIQFEDGTGYYIEQELDMKQGDKAVVIGESTVIVNGKVYTIE